MSQTTLLIAAIVLMLLGADATVVHWMLSQRSVAQESARDLAECTDVSSQIELLRKKPAVATTQAVGVRELGQKIEAAGERAHLPPLAIEGVLPQPSRRLDDSPYLVKPTTLTLRGVTLTQFVTFLFALSDHSGLSVRELRLRTPHEAPNVETWDAEATLTYLIYSAAPAGPGVRAEP